MWEFNTLVCWLSAGTKRQLPISYGEAAKTNTLYDLNITHNAIGSRHCRQHTTKRRRPKILKVLKVYVSPAENFGEKRSVSTTKRVHA
jgi:hypothetical protein